MDYLSLCLIAKNENEYLQEWIDYHILLGVERFYLYDNQSSVPIRNALRDYVEAGWVTVVDIEGKGMQLQAYDHCLQTFGKYSKWIGFIDTDEFLVPKTTSSLSEFLKDYETYGGLAVSSLFFGPGGHKHKPAGGQIANYHLRMENGFTENRLIKCLVQPEKTCWPASPHLFDFLNGHYTVNEDFARVDCQKFPHSIKKIQLNHYYTRSEEEITAKLERGRGDAGAPYREKRFKSIINESKTPDVEILTVLSKILKQNGLLKTVPDKPDPNNIKLLETIHNLVLQKNAKPFIGHTSIKFSPRQAFTDYTKKVLETANLIEKRDWENARKIKFELIEEMPHCISHLTDFAFICLQQNDFQAAWQAIARSWKIAPQSYLILQIMADFYTAVGDFTWVEKVSQMMIAQGPQETSSFYSLANALLHQGQIEKGLQLALSILPDLYYSAIENQIRAVHLTKTIQPHLYAKGEKRKIIDLYNLAIQVSPRDMGIYATLTQIFLEMKDNKNADQMIARALEVDPDNNEILKLKELARKR